MSRPQRTLHVLDIENLAGGPALTPHTVARLRDMYEAAAPVVAGDEVVVATAHFGAKAAELGWPSSRRLAASGPDGADLQLLKVLSHERVEGRFTRVVIGSGDGIFAMAAAHLQARGIPASVVSRAGALSRQLLLAVRDIRLLNDPTPHCGSAASAA